MLGSLQLEETIHHILGEEEEREGEQNVSHRNNFGVKGTRATEAVFLNFVLL